MASDYYELLGVSRSASAEEIKRAFRSRARELHPDTNPDPSAEERFKEMALAYEVLSDPERRRRYDTFGPEGVGPTAGSDPFSGFGGFGDIFDAVFGGGGAGPFGAGGRTRAAPARGADMELTVDLDFTEAVFGVTRDIKVRAPVKCSACEGSGAAPGTSPVRCEECEGRGEIRRVRQTILGQMVSASPCSRCGGLGQRIPQPCPSCRGEGRRTEERDYTVDVPAGVDGGSTLRLSGRGAVGPRGVPAGDLYVHLQVRPHPRFGRENTDLLHELHVPLTTAALGAVIDFETLDGTEELTVPAGTQTGHLLRLRGRGVPHLDGRSRGDLRITLVVDTPTGLSPAAEDLLRQLAEERGEAVAAPSTGLFSRLRDAFKA